MRIYDVICRKRDGAKLRRDEIEYFVQAVTRGEVADYQASALLMAICLRGMSVQETAWLTQAMAQSGARFDLSSLPGRKVDKHSTGGVGDGLSLTVAPLVAACGLAVPMISGRGLGHTGGTLDKLASIPGLRVDLKRDEFLAQLGRVGAALIGQTEEVAPADRKLYALRDVTGTVESIPLISSSILSKKIAEGCDALLLDVKTGDGAFMRERKDALILARRMVQIGRRAKLKVLALITNMDQPLGKAVGNALEIEQAVEVLSGKEEALTKDFVQLTDVLGGWMLFLGGKCAHAGAGREAIRAARLNGSGLRKFRQIVEAQGGDPRVCEDPRAVLPQARQRQTVPSPWKGTISRMQARHVGIAAQILGAGRRLKEDPIDPAAGILLYKKLGDKVERGEPVAELRAGDPARFDAAREMFLAGVKIGKARARRVPLVMAVVR